MKFFPEIKILSDNAVLPIHATPGSAGYDLYLPTDTPEKVVIYPGEVKRFCLGFAIDLKSPDAVMLIFPRSGSGSKGLHLANSTGVIDSDYQGEVMVLLKNTAEEPLTIDTKKAVAQAVFVPCYRAAAVTVSEFTRETDRGAGGFGSTDSTTA